MPRRALQQHATASFEHAEQQGSEEDRQTCPDELCNSTQQLPLNMPSNREARRIDRHTQTKYATTTRNSFLEHAMQEGSREDRQKRLGQLCNNMQHRAFLSTPYTVQQSSRGDRRSPHKPPAKSATTTRNSLLEHAVQQGSQDTPPAKSEKNRATALFSPFVQQSHDKLAKHAPGKL